MDLVFLATCPACGHELPVDSAIRNADVQLECPKCRRAFDIPPSSRADRP